MGCVFCSGVLVIMEYFERRIGVAVAFGAANASIGGIIYSVMAVRLLPTVGFAWTMRYIGFAALGTMIPSEILHRPRYLNRRKSGPVPKPTFNFLSQPAFLFMAFGMFLSFCSIYFEFYYIVSYGYNVLRLSQTMFVNLLLTMLAANLPGRFLPALISDTYIGPLNTLIPSCVLTSMISFLWIGTSSPTGIFLIAAFYGFTSAGPRALFNPTTAIFFERCDDGTDDPSKEVKSAVVFIAIGVACATGTPISGALIDRGTTDAPHGMPCLYGQLFAASAMAAAGVCFCISRLYRVGWRAVKDLEVLTSI